jgi:ApbE superfamily uncharacterized protein (UPF0280 family)
MQRVYEKRTYRSKVRARGLHAFCVRVKETDLWISAGQDLEQEARDLVFQCRYEIESYLKTHPFFKISLRPLSPDSYAPPLVREMIASSGKAGVGPMAAVAGAIAQYVGKGLLEYTNEVIVENGGDIYLKAERPVTVSILAGDSPLSGRIGLSIPVEQMPLGVCTSSGRVGHSLSRGISHAVSILAPSAALADSAATALANTIMEKKDLESVASAAGNIPGIFGGIAILGDTMASWGAVRLINL